VVYKIIVIEKKIHHIVFLGPQGSGKGTQAELLAKDLKLPVISTGAIYREESKKKTVLGEQVGTYMNQGKLVPDDITNALVSRRLEKKDCAKGFILDGFPRTLSQASALDEMVVLTHVILINISDKEAVYRISGRLMCKCGATYHQKFNPPKVIGVCDNCGEKLFVRKDDSEESALRKRLAIYHQEIDPIIEYYRQKNVLFQINGEKSISEVCADVIKIFK